MTAKPNNTVPTRSPEGGELWKQGAIAPTVLGGKTYTPAAWYPSSRNPNDGYTVCEVSDGTVSCDCMGWTRRNPPGGRTCKHTKDYLAYLRPLWQQGGTSTAPLATGSPRSAPVFARVPAEVQASEREKGGTLADLFARLEKGGLGGS